MKTLKITLASLVLIWTVGYATSCKKVEEVKETITSAEDQTNAETEFTSAFDVSDDVNSTDGKLKKFSSTILPSGAVVNVIDSSFTDGDGIEYTVDFGPLGTTAPKGRLCLDGKYRAGKLRVTLSDRYSTVGAIATVTMNEADSFFSGDGLNMTHVSGLITVTRTTNNSVNVVVSNGKAVNSRGTVTWSSNKVITRTLDFAGPGLLGDKFEVTGSGSGVNTKGTAYTVTIDVPLVKWVKVGCANTFIKGKFTIKNSGSSTDIKVDFDPYNNEACDKVAKAIIGSKEFIFTVK